MSKDTLLKHLTTKGKDMSWDELARVHKIKDGEKARQTWKHYRLNKGLGANLLAVVPQAVAKERALRAFTGDSRASVDEVACYVPPKGDTLLELSIPDLHIGKMSWDKESGEDYDIEIATKRFKDAVEVLVSRVNPTTVERILLPLGNDLLNVDNKMNTTTAGTPQSSDSRFGKIFRTVRSLMVETIDKLSAIAPVDVLIVPGNHDEATMFTLGELLDAWYRESKRVKIFNSPKLRKYYQYGQNAIMFTHGDKEKHSELGLIMAHEEPKLWGVTKYREVHLGHLHKSKSIQYTTGDEFPGFKIRILPSLCSADAWHYAQGYLSAKAAKAFVWQKDQGLIAEYTYNL
jgi:hypothetical protein